MVMPPYTIQCQACGAKASLKVASHWSDGETRELKTYSIVCDRCLDAALKMAKARYLHCQVLPGESIEPPGVWELGAGKSSGALVRRPDLENASQ